MARSKTLTDLKLPAKYTEVESTRIAWDFKKEPILEGKIAGFREVWSEKKKAKQRVCDVVDGNGVIHCVYERAGLVAVFECVKGESVYLIYRGTKDIGRENPLEVFTVGVAQ